jgi:hypothetical protein
MADTGFMCRACGRVFVTEYELLTHIHLPGEILAETDPLRMESDPPMTPKGLAFGISPKTGVIRYEKFPGKIGYRRRGDDGGR